MAQEISNVLRVTGEVRMEQPYTDLVLEDGRRVRVPTHLFMTAAPAAAEDAEVREGVIPVIEESLTVTKRVVETGKVILRKSVREIEQLVDEPLAVRTYEVERVALNQVVAGLPETRREGTTTVYPVVEERLVVRKELVLVEEIRVTERVGERRAPETMTLRREDVVVERVPVER